MIGTLRGPVREISVINDPLAVEPDALFISEPLHLVDGIEMERPETGKENENGNQETNNAEHACISMFTYYHGQQYIVIQRW